ncbi:MAG: ABC transporter permease [Bryobacteraceae bacterium]
MSGSIQLRHTLRALTRSPGFTAIAVITIASAIGVNSAIFSVVNAVLLRPLPFAAPDSLVLLWGTDRTGNDRDQISFTDLDDWRRQNRVFQHVAAYEHWDAVLSGDFEPERVPGMRVSDGYFALMRGGPLLGRVLLPEDQVEGKDRVVVLGFDLWKRKFAGNPAVIGNTILLNGRPYTIVGVMPPAFRSLPASLVGAPADLYRPVAENHDDRERSSRHLRGIARLKPDITAATAQAELDVLTRSQEVLHPESDKGRGVRVVKLRDDLVRNVRRALLVLQGAGGFVLLIACANLANLLLARSTARRKELAVRSALGAGRGTLVMQAFVESLVLAAAGGACGLLLALWSADSLRRLGARVIPELASLQLDAPVLIFAVAITLITGVLFGAVPAIQYAPDLIKDLKAGGRTSSGGIRRGVRHALVMSQVGVAVLLLTGAGLLLRSFVRLQGIDPGFDPYNVLTANVALPSVRYPIGPGQVRFYQQVIERVRRQPGVVAAAAVSVLPESANFDTAATEIEGRTVSPEDQPYLDRYVVTPDYFRALSIPLHRGRAFTERDDQTSPMIALINETAARTYWQGQNPIGKRLRVSTFDLSQDKAPWRTIVGVVGDVYQYGLDAKRSAQLYFPHAQLPTGDMTLVIRSAHNPSALEPGVQAAVQAFDKDQPLYDVATMEQVMAESLSSRRFSLVLLAAFAALALALACVGVYGVVSYSVSQRTQEFGTRLALGAKPRDLLRLVIGQGMAVVSAGVIAGVVAAIVLTRFLASLLFEVRPTDLAAFGASIALLVGVAALACYIPARRAMRVDPMSALRWE